MPLFRRRGPDTPPGSDLLDRVVQIGWDSLGSRRIDDLYRAALRGARVAIAQLLNEPGEIRDQWGSGSTAQALRLITVWGSTVTLVLLQRQPSQEAVCRDIATGFAALYRVDESDLFTELDAYRRQRAAEAVDDNYAQNPFSFHMLLMRTLAVLGSDTADFRLMNPPYLGFDDLAAEVPLPPGAFSTDVATFLLAQHALLTGLTAAQSTYEELTASGR